MYPAMTGLAKAVKTNQVELRCLRSNEIQLRNIKIYYICAVYVFWRGELASFSVPLGIKLIVCDSSQATKTHKEKSP